MARHLHEWDTPYEFHGSTYRECSDSACRAHQQWVCALDRWSGTFETPSQGSRSGHAGSTTCRPDPQRFGEYA